ncbi:hypothetical protein E4T56_gene6134 [Termitomyces sp. T112]|nr:hypothetical protein E4T56_gene6134 [Termitomyces sp. T112]
MATTPDAAAVLVLGLTNRDFDRLNNNGNGGAIQEPIPSTPAHEKFHRCSSVYYQKGNTEPTTHVPMQLYTL